MEKSPTRLCIFCRRIEPTSEPCPWISARLDPGPNNPTASVSWLQPVTPFTDEDARLIESLRNQPSSLCQRCSDYDIVAAFRDFKPVDAQQCAELDPDSRANYVRERERYEMPLGLLSDLHLTPACSLCRLIYRILPRNALDPDDGTMKITPIRAYERRQGWEAYPLHVRSQFSIRLGLLDYNTPTAISFTAGSPLVRLEGTRGEVIALDTRQTTPDKRLFSARLFGPLVDVDSIKEALRNCAKFHPNCGTSWPPEMARTRMVDVARRTTVPCPDQCDYVALSYVIGGILPKDDDLERGTLPRTLEDAITLTKKLGKRYLWVDALCIIQHPVTPGEIAEKQEQLSIMHLIYECASITVVNVSGTNTDSGIPGISSPRYTQISETIDGHTFFTAPPVMTADINASIWDTRAWTLQEMSISRRTLFVSANQARFECGLMSADEAEDTTTFGTEDLLHPMSPIVTMMAWGAPAFEQHPGSSQQISGNLIMFSGILAAYTVRNMTNDSDSINAFLGMLAVLKRRLFPSGFVHGLPLYSHPESLAWFHDRDIVPKRRLAFPSWSWAGWEGQVFLPEALVEPENDRLSVQTDLTVKLVSVNDKEIVLSGWFVTLDIRAAPFSEAFNPRTNELIGSVVERNFRTNTTIPSGLYSCLVVQRVTRSRDGKLPGKQYAFLLVLDWVTPGLVARRKTLLTVMPFIKDGEFMRSEPERGTVTLI